MVPISAIMFIHRQADRALMNAAFYTAGAFTLHINPYDRSFDSLCVITSVHRLV